MYERSLPQLWVCNDARLKDEAPSLAMPDTVSYKIIGIIRSEHVLPSETPIQPCFAEGCKARVELLPEYEEGLNNIEGFSHLILIYHLHQAGSMSLTVKPFLQDMERGVFATRHPCRPNPIGISTVRLLRRDGATLFVENVDILDGTPLLDIKPYAAKFDYSEAARSGWLDTVNKEAARQRGRRGYRRTEKPSSGE